ncbi:MAG: ATP-binding protein [Anaerolineae bacterium]|nr:ATP-binding protein [Anaerolineae bacterium]
MQRSQVMLVLCGSYIRMMEATVLGYQAPLYGRRTGQYLLEPLGFADARLLFPGYSPEDQVRAYAVYGGTPAYLQTIQPEAPLADNIVNGILSRGAFLYDEVRFVLQQELREPRNCFAVLQATAAGRTRLNEIRQATRIEGVSAYLDTLQQLHLVERAVPVTESQPHKSRRGLYRLKDPFLRFWFRYVHPNRSQPERGGGQVVLETQVLPQLDGFTGPVFEDICQQFCWRAGLSGGLPFTPHRVGGWWDANEEIDLVALGRLRRSWRNASGPAARWGSTSWPTWNARRGSPPATWKGGRCAMPCAPALASPRNCGRPSPGGRTCCSSTCRCWSVYSGPDRSDAWRPPPHTSRWSPRPVLPRVDLSRLRLCG